jgi:hypothetical protein
MSGYDYDCRSGATRQKSKNKRAIISAQIILQEDGIFSEENVFSF